MLAYRRTQPAHAIFYFLAIFFFDKSVFFGKLQTRLLISRVVTKLFADIFSLAAAGPAYILKLVRHAGFVRRHGSVVFGKFEANVAVGLRVTKLFAERFGLAARASE